MGIAYINLDCQYEYPDIDIGNNPFPPPVPAQEYKKGTDYTDATAIIFEKRNRAIRVIRA